MLMLPDLASGQVPKINTQELEDFIMWFWRKEKGIMAQVEALVNLSILLLFIQVIFGWWRRCCHSTFIKYSLWLAYTTTPAVVIYTLGLMQSSLVNSVLLQSWSYGLLVALGSTNSITAYNVEDNKQYLRHVMHHSAYVLNFVLMLKMEVKLVSLLALVFLFGLPISMNVGRLVATKMASSFSDDGSLYIAKHMKREHEESPSYDPVSLLGYNYLVSWPSSQVCRSLPGREITVSMIWQHTEDVHLKEVCLSFALFQLLRRRFYGVACEESKQQKTHDFVFEGLLSNVEAKYKTAYKVIETELAFTFDYFFTSAASFNTGLGYLIIMQTVLRVPFIYLVPVLESIHCHAITMMALMMLLPALELLQLYIYLSSDWAKIRIACRLPSDERTVCDAFFSFCRRLPQIFGLWQNKIGQHSLLKDLHRRSHTSDIIGTLSWFIFAKILQCQEKSYSRGINNPGIVAPDRIMLTDDVKLAVALTLKSSNGHLSNGESSLLKNCQSDLLWACRHDNHASTILIWHIATDYCEIADDAAISLQAGATDTTEHHQNEKTEHHQNVARTLSRYCAYLMAVVPELLPDHPLDTTVCFREARKDALKYLSGDRSAQSMYKKMRALNQRMDRGEGTFMEGIWLGKQLERISHANRWKILADFWTEMILYIAPSDNARDHLQHLANGGEFLTHLWALLSHAGILSREERQSFDEESPATVHPQGPTSHEPHGNKTQDSKMNSSHHQEIEEVAEDSASNKQPRGTAAEAKLLASTSRRHVQQGKISLAG